jgi:hypothetical protein
MSVSPEILAKQQEYAARPYAAYVNSSHFSGCFRFHKEADAIGYLFDSYFRKKQEIARGPHQEWHGWDAHRSYLAGPAGKIPARFVLMADNLSSRLSFA